jgi:branched-chain amino acid transport system substrate-binding protein
MWQAGVYSSVIHYLEAVKATGSDDALTVAAKMRETPIEDFFTRHGTLRPEGGRRRPARARRLRD